MSLGRTGDPDDQDDAYHRAHCSGWLTAPDDDHPRPCLRYKKHFIPTPEEDPESHISDRARAAIQRESRNA